MYGTEFHDIPLFRLTIDRRRNELNEIDLKIAIALGCGHTRERAAELAGVSASTVYNHCDQPITRQWGAFTKLCAESSIAHQVEVNSAAVKREWEKRRLTAFGVHDAAMAMVKEAPALALRAAEGVFDRADGKATQTLHTSSVNELTVTHSIDPDLLEYWQTQARALKPAPTLLPQPALPILDADEIPAS